MVSNAMVTLDPFVLSSSIIVMCHCSSSLLLQHSCGTLIAVH